MTKDTEEPASAGGIQGEVDHDRFVGARDLTRWNGRAGHTLAAAVQRVSRALGPHSALILTLLAGAVIAITLTLIFAEVYESVVEADGVAGLDHPVLDTAKTLRSPVLDTAVTATPVAPSTGDVPATVGAVVSVGGGVGVVPRGLSEYQ